MVDVAFLNLNLFALAPSTSPVNFSEQLLQL